jgi:hypothetical protein
MRVIRKFKHMNVVHQVTFIVDGKDTDIWVPVLVIERVACISVGDIVKKTAEQLFNNYFAIPPAIHLDVGEVFDTSELHNIIQLSPVGPGEFFCKLNDIRTLSSGSRSFHHFIGWALKQECILRRVIQQANMKRGQVFLALIYVANLITCMIRPFFKLYNRICYILFCISIWAKLILLPSYNMYIPNCPVCLTTPKAPTHICINGHTTCGACKYMCEKCPVCRGGWAAGPNRMVDDILKFNKIPVKE